MVCHGATHRYPHGRVEPPRRIRWPHQHVASRLPRIDPLKNSGNRLSFASSGSRSRFREGKQVPCVGLFTPLGVLRSYVIARVLLLSWNGCCLSLRSCSPFTWLPLPRESAPRLARQAIAPAEASLSLLLRGLCWLSALLFVIMLALTPASSTPAPCPRALFATLVTSRRRVHDRRRREALSSQGLPVRRLHLGSSTPLCTRSDSRSVQSSCSFASSSLAERIQPLLKVGLLLTAIRESNLHRLDLGAQELFRVLFQWRV